MAGSSSGHGTLFLHRSKRGIWLSIFRDLRENISCALGEFLKML